MKKRILTTLLLSQLLLGCAAVSKKNLDYNPAKSHHTPTGFRNKHLDTTVKKDFSRLLSWQYEKMFKEDESPDVEIPGIAPNIDFLQSNTSDVSLTWIGHSSLLYQVYGKNILLDPIFSDRASPVQFMGPKRYQDPGLKISELPKIDAVVLSHGHFDHLDLNSVREVMERNIGHVKFYVPLGMQYWFYDNVPGSIISGENQNVFSHDWDDLSVIPTDRGNIELRFLGVQHWSKRHFIHTNDMLWGSWEIHTPDFNFWFAGDLGYSRDVEELASKLRDVDLAAIPIGAYEPRWFMETYHIDPASAVKIMEEIGAKEAMAVHWGTFKMSEEGNAQPPVDLKKALVNSPISEDRFSVFKHGETKVYKRTK